VESGTLAEKNGIKWKRCSQLARTGKKKKRVTHKRWVKIRELVEGAKRRGMLIGRRHAKIKQDKSA